MAKLSSNIRVINDDIVDIKNAGQQSLKPETEVTIEADHMPGMKGAKGVIDSAEHTTVYMVDCVPTVGGEPVKNHKWVIESELSLNKLKHGS